MHNIYNTKALIIKNIPIGEANKMYFLLTKDLGFIKATAQGVRLGKSKLKGHLQDFSIVNISLVRGKEIWRITSSEVIKQKLWSDKPEGLLVLKNVFSLLLRLLHGEEKNEKLFLCIENFYNFIFEEKVSDEDIKNIETLIVLRVLYNLGYFKKRENFHEYCEGEIINNDILSSFNNIRKQVIYDINMSLKETHL